MKEKDIYDQEIERLTANPEDIYSSWENAEPLFQFAGSKSVDNCGCLSMIRESDFEVKIHPDVDDILTKEIREDARIPIDMRNATPECLPVFAEWQRKLDVYREKYKNS